MFRSFRDLDSTLELTSHLRQMMGYIVKFDKCAPHLVTILT
jgi:hypothetical protein